MTNEINVIVNGLWNGTIKLINNPNDGCIACEIGDYWFYFIGSDDENMTLDEVKKSYTVFEIAELISDAISDLDETERSYYYSIIYND